MNNGDTGVELIAAERLRQVVDKGYSFDKDDQNTQNELVDAAICHIGYPNRVFRQMKSTANSITFLEPWPWALIYDKRKTNTRIRNLTVAGALIAAEIDRLQRKSDKKQ